MPPRRKLPPALAQPEGPARRTRAATRSPTKQPPAQPPPPMLRKPPQQRPSKPVAEEVQEGTSMPPRPSVPVKRSYVIPAGLIAYTQPRSDEEFIEEDEPGPIINGAFGRAGHYPNDDEDVSPEEDLSPTTPHRRRQRITGENLETSSESESDNEDDTRSFDDEDAMTGLALPQIEIDGDMDVEIYQGHNGDAYVNISPPHRGTRRSTVGPTSPLVARTARMNKQPKRTAVPPPATSEDEAAAIVAAGEDVLEAHQAKRRRVAPTIAKLAAAAQRLDEIAQQNHCALARSGLIAASSTNPATAAAPLPPAQRPAPAAAPLRTTLATMVNPITGAARAIRSIVPGGQVDIATAARLPNPPIEDDSFENPNGLGRKRKRSSNPAPHHLQSKTPNTRIVLRRGKDEYGFRIIVNNAYPDAHQRVVEARAAHDVALLTMSDAAAVASGASWSPAKVRLYGDTGWVRRSSIKAAASTHTPQSYRLSIPPLLAERIPGGSNHVNTRTYIQNRIEYLLDRGRWMRGNHGRHTSMLYAHPIFATLLEQTVYRPASSTQRASLSPMPLPAIALVATAVLCSLEEWSTGVRVKISFTEETYARIYKNHLTRLQRMSHTHQELIGTLQEHLYEYCVARNEAQPVAQPELEDDLDDLDVLDSAGNSDAEDDGALAEQSQELGNFYNFDDE